MTSRREAHFEFGTTLCKDIGLQIRNKHPPEPGDSGRVFFVKLEYTRGLECVCTKNPQIELERDFGPSDLV